MSVDSTMTTTSVDKETKTTEITGRATTLVPDMKDYAKRSWYGSRKYRTTWYLTGLVTLVFVGPEVLSAFGFSIQLIDSDQWITFLELLWPAWMTSAVIGKHKSMTNHDSDMPVTSSTISEDV